MSLKLTALEQLIGTDICSYCGQLTECLSVQPDGMAQALHASQIDRSACQSCIRNAFVEYWNEKEETE